MAKQKPASRICTLLFASFCLVFAAFPASAAEWGKCLKDPLWSECSVDTDCTIISSPCGWPTESVNKASAEEAETCNIREGARYGCAMYDEERDGTYEAACVQNKCVAQKQE